MIWRAAREPFRGRHFTGDDTRVDSAEICSRLGGEPENSGSCFVFPQAGGSDRLVQQAWGAVTQGLAASDHLSNFGTTGSADNHGVFALSRTFSVR